jgi:ketosteroid isomerase-like protein
MTEDDERVSLVRRGWEAYEAGDVAQVLERFDPEVVVYAPPEAGNPGTFHGHDGFLSWVGHWFDAWDEFSQEVAEIEPVGERCVIVEVSQTARGRTAALELERTAWYVYELRDRRVVYMGLFVDADAARASAAEREAR